MIEATVKHIQPGSRGFTARAFARSTALVSSENPRGELIFYIEPPSWTAGRPPHVGQVVMVGEVERKTKPHWTQPRWLARDVSPANAIKRYSPKRVAQATTLVRGESTTWVARILMLFGFRPSSGLNRA
jgi:hypothetical protein